MVVSGTRAAQLVKTQARLAQTETDRFMKLVERGLEEPQVITPDEIRKLARALLRILNEDEKD